MKLPTIVFIINGQDVPTEIWPSAETLGDARARALPLSQVFYRKPEEFELRGPDGTLLDPDATLVDSGLTSGARVFATLKIGIGGNFARAA
jgi:hypothetical protein